MSETEERLTVAEAAGKLGVSVRTLRRLLSVAKYGGRTQAVERHTSKGIRVTTMVPPDLLTDLRANLHLVNGEQAGEGNEGNTKAEPRAFSEASGGAPPNDATEPAEDGSLPAPAYRAVIQAQAQTIEAMRSEVAYLREALTLAQQNLTREQTLRALPAPTLEAPQSAPEAAQTGAVPQYQAQAVDRQAPEKQAPEKQAPEKQAPERPQEASTGNWWARLWGR